MNAASIAKDSLIYSLAVHGLAMKSLIRKVPTVVLHEQNLARFKQKCLSLHHAMKIRVSD